MSTLTEFYGGGGDTNTYIELQGGSPGGGITFSVPATTGTAPAVWGGSTPQFFNYVNAVGQNDIRDGTTGVTSSNSSDSAYWSLFQVTSRYISAGSLYPAIFPSQKIGLNWTSGTSQTPYTSSTGGFTVATGSKVEWEGAPTVSVTLNGPELKTFSNVTWTGTGAGTSFTLNLPKLENFDRMCFGLTTGFVCDSSPNLANITNMRVISGGTDGVISIQNAALSYDSVSDILRTIARTSSSITLTGLQISLQGGTSAGTSQLTVADIANLSACVARGITIQLNA